MSGYCGYSMSNNAISAYNSGEKPMSKWTKVAILEEIKCAIGEGLVLQVSLEDLAQLPAAELKARFCFNLRGIIPVHIIMKLTFTHWIGTR